MGNEVGTCFVEKVLEEIAVFGGIARSISGGTVGRKLAGETVPVMWSTGATRPGFARRYETGR